MKVEIRDYYTIEIQPESIQDHMFLMRFKDAEVQVEGPVPFGFNGSTLKLVLPQVDKENIV